MAYKTFNSPPFHCSYLNKDVTIKEIKDVRRGVSPNAIDSSKTECSGQEQCEMHKDPSKCPCKKMRQLYQSE